MVNTGIKIKLKKILKKIITVKKNLGIQIVNLREKGLPLISDLSVTVNRPKTNNDLNNLFQSALKLISCARKNIQI